MFEHDLPQLSNVRFLFHAYMLINHLKILYTEAPLHPPQKRENPNASTGEMVLIKVLQSNIRTNLLATETASKMLSHTLRQISFSGSSFA